MKKNSSVQSTDGIVSEANETSKKERIALQEKKVIDRINTYLRRNNIKQNQFALQAGLDAASFSKMLNAKQDIRLSTLLQIANAMQIDPGQLVTDGDGDLDGEVIFSPERRNRLVDSKMELFITDPNSTEFNGMLNLYHFYTHPTISAEKQNFLKGTLELKAVEAGDGQNKRRKCEATLNLNTGKLDADGNSIIKTFIGDVIISKATNSCFMTLYCQQYSDFCCLNWTHIYLNYQKLECRMVSILTTSAGVSTNRKPVMLKGIISLKKFDDDALNEIAGQLKMNNAEIHVLKSEYDRLRDSKLLTENDKLFLENNKYEEHYAVWSEDRLRARGFATDMNRRDLVNLLRNVSSEKTYVKISSKSDECLYDFIQSRQESEFYQSDYQRSIGRLRFPRAFVFDMDGVIFDSEQLVVDCWKVIADKYGFSERIEEACRNCLGINAQAAKQEFLKIYGDSFPYDEYKQEMSDLFHERADGGRLPMKPYVLKLLVWLKNHGVKIALASSTRREVVTAQLDAAGILPLFDSVVCGDMVSRSKPDPEIFLKACRELHVKPYESFGVEDSYNGVRASSNGGLRTIMVPDLLEPTKEMKDRCETIKENLGEIIEYLTGLYNLNENNTSLNQSNTNLDGSNKQEN